MLGPGEGTGDPGEETAREFKLLKVSALSDVSLPVG